MKRLVSRILPHCIASLAAALLMTAALTQGSRPISLRDAQRWQELQGQADAALAKGDYGQAESPGKQAVAAGSAGFGAVDQNVASSWSGLGSAQLRNNNRIEAENSFRQALTI